MPLIFLRGDLLPWHSLWNEGEHEWEEMGTVQSPLLTSQVPCLSQDILPHSPCLCHHGASCLLMVSAASLGPILNYLSLNLGNFRGLALSPYL